MPAITLISTSRMRAQLGTTAVDAQPEIPTDTVEPERDGNFLNSCTCR